MKAPNTIVKINALHYNFKEMLTKRSRKTSDLKYTGLGLIWWRAMVEALRLTNRTKKIKSSQLLARRTLL